MFWTVEEENKLRNLIQQGFTYLQISKIMNKSKNSVLGKADRLNLKYLAKKDKDKKIKKVSKPILKCEAYIPPNLEGEPQSLKLTIHQLENNNCRYISVSDNFFCGHKTEQGSSYCKYHKKICNNTTLPPS